MKTRPVVPARIDWSDAAAPFAPDFADRYHPREGALAQATHVFIGGNGLPERWHGRARFALLETGFGLGNNFLATWSAWHEDRSHRCARLHFVSIDKHPPTARDLARAHAASPLREPAQALIAQWPPLTPNLHRLAFDDGRVELLLLFADIDDGLSEIVGRFDAFYLDGFAPATNPAMWQPRVFAALSRLAAPGATAATWSVAREVRDGLARAGFAVARAPGFGPKREMTVASFAPRHVAAALAGRPPSVGARDIAVIGAGLAGCAAAAALADNDHDVTLFDRHGVPALGASGQSGGVFHGIVHRVDGTHARFTRAAALLAERELRDAIDRRGVDGEICGLLRLEGRDPDVPRMRETLAQQALPPSYVDALDAARATSLAGVAIAAPAWHYAGGGWVDPRALCAAWSAMSTLRRQHIAALRRDGERWQLLDESGRVVASASIVVWAGGADGSAGLGDACASLSRTRGQTTRLPADTPGLRAPALPIADAGYALRLADDSVLCGASSAIGNTAAEPRDADRHANLQRLERLTGSRVATSAACEERVGFRLVAADRLPLVGPLPANDRGRAARLDQPRFVPRAPGVFVLTALGSRGITWAALAARLLAAQIAGSPWPLEASLADALDPARFAVRAIRRSTS